MPPKFGTSGLRGRARDLTSKLISRYVLSFLAHCDVGDRICVGCDLRESSSRLLEAVMTTAQRAGYHTVDCGAIPTPALALHAQGLGCGAIMVTGSHIPADRNGLKFYSRQGEITKAEETLIRDNLAARHQVSEIPGRAENGAAAAKDFKARYVTAFGPRALAGKRIGFYAHSAVGRDVLPRILSGLGAQVIELDRSATFIPIDTEAVSPDLQAQMAAWVVEHKLDALVSTDGDSDRPLCVDEQGQLVPGDILGQITAESLQAETVVTPVSSNSGIFQKGHDIVTLTRIGSPFVIEAMQAAAGKTVGYEANGGFLLGFEAQGPAGPLAPLMTRDCTLPLIAVLYAAGQGGVAARVALEPPIVTRADRLQEVPQEFSGPLLARLTEDAVARADFLAKLGQRETSLDLTDGLRITLAGGGTLHLRPSGNAPELRVYVEGRDAPAAQALLQAALAHLRALLTG